MKSRDHEQSDRARIFARYGSLLPLIAAIATGCATQDDGSMPGGGGSDTGGTSTSGSAGTGTSGNATAGSSASGSSNGGSATAGTGGNATSGSAGMSTSGSAGMSTTGGGGANGGGGASGSGGTAGSGGKGGAGGTNGGAGAGGKGGAGSSGGTTGGAGAGGKGGSGGTGGMSGAGGSGGSTGCTLVTDCPNDDNTIHNVCDAGKCRVRGCTATNCAYELTRLVLGTKAANTAQGQAFVTWDASNLHIDFQIHDLTPENDSALNWQDDSVEIYLDLNHAKTGAYDADDYQITIPRDAGTIVGLGTGINFGAIVVARTESAAGYELKVTLPWSALNGAGSQVGNAIGFSLGVNDDSDGGDTREAQLMLFGDANNYQSDTNFGTLQL